MMLSNYEDNAKIFRAFCDENRLMILELLHDGEKCACVLLKKLKIGQSTLSHHMKILCDSGIVKGRKEGKWTFYSINQEGISNAINILDELKGIPAKATEDCCEDK
jgi:ArsR family transcriptional regulator